MIEIPVFADEGFDEEGNCNLCGECKFQERLKTDDWPSGRVEYADPCLGVLPGVKFACCGHGLNQGYIFFEDDTTVRFVMTSAEKRHDGKGNPVQYEDGFIPIPPVVTDVVAENTEFEEHATLVHVRYD